MVPKNPFFKNSWVKYVLNSIWLLWLKLKVDKAGIVHAPIGKVSFSSDKIAGNASELIQTLIKLTPTGAKGTYIKSIFISSTMSPSLAIDPKI